MNFLSKLLLLGVALPAAVLPVEAQQPPDAVITFQFERPGLPVPSFLVTVHRDGTGTYAATVAPLEAQTSRYGSYVAAPTGPSTEIKRTIALTPQITAQLFEQVHTTNRFHGGCESKAKNIASSGVKTLTYSGPDGQGHCVYNYTEIKPVAALADAFLAIAFTLDEGRKLDQAHRYDRLGLDEEMRILVEAVHDGRAIELGNIRSTLASIAEDNQLLERARGRAATLLAGITLRP